MTGSVVSSVTRFGKYEPFELQVARGQITMHSSVQKFGYSSVIDGTTYPIWNVAANRTYLTTATVMKVSSSSASDTSADRKSTRLNSSHIPLSRMPSSA